MPNGQVAHGPWIFRKKAFAPRHNRDRGLVRVAAPKPPTLLLLYMIIWFIEFTDG
jgi:hypothetical protein